MFMIFFNGMLAQINVSFVDSLILVSVSIVIFKISFFLIFNSANAAKEGFKKISKALTR